MTGVVVALTLFFALPSAAEAADRYWVGSAGGNTDSSANWASADPASCTGGGATVPGGSDVAIFDADCDNSATINATFSVLGVDIKSGYAGTITQNTTITIAVNASGFIQAGGTFTGGDAAITLTDGSFNQSGGTFTNTSGGLNIERNFTVSAGTFTNTSKTVTLADNNTLDASTVTCSETLGGTFVFTKDNNANNITIASGCGINLGASPNSNMDGGGTVTNNGTITVASGTWSFGVTGTGASSQLINAGTITHSGNGWDFNNAGLTNNSGATITYAGTAITMERSFTQSGTFDLTGITITFDDTNTADDTTVTCSGTLGGTVVITKDSGGDFIVASGCSIALGASPTTTVILGSTYTNNGTMVIASGTWTISGGGATLTNAGTITHSGTGWNFNDGSLTNNSGATITYAGTAITMDRSFTQSGTFDLTGKTITFDDESNSDDSTVTCSGTLGGTVVITKNSSGDFIVASGCSIALGASPTSAMGSANLGTYTNNGTITIASGTWTITGGGVTLTNAGTITHSGNGWILSEIALTNNSGATITYSTGGATITADGNITQNGTLTFSGTTTFIADTAGGDATTLTCSGTFPGTVVFTRNQVNSLFTLAAGCAISLGASPTSTLEDGSGITNNGTITIDSGTWTINPGSSSLTGNFINSSGATLTHNGSAISLESNFTQNGTMTFSGTTTFRDDAANHDSTLTCGGTMAGNVTINKTLANSDFLLGSSCTITGNFTRTDGPISNPGSAMTLTVQGNFSMSTTDLFGGANLTLTMGGSGTQTITQNAGTMSGVFKVDKTGGSASLATNFTTGTTCNVVEGTFAITNKTFACGSTFTVEDGGNFQRAGNETTTTPTLNSGSTVTYVGDGDAASDTITVTSTNTDYHHITFNATDGATDTFQLGAGITVAGNWTNTAGTFSANSQTVTLDGTNQTMAGSTTFYNLTKSVTAAATLTFTAGTTQTVANTLTLNGATGQLLSLRSSSTPTQWNINPQGTRTVSFLDVKDSNNTNATTMVCANNCTDSENNTNWGFPLRGTVYTDEGVTNIGAGATVAVSINGGTATTATTDSSGRYRFNGLTIVDGDIIIVYIDGGAVRGATVTKVSGQGTLGILHIYQNRLIVRAEAAGTLANTNLDTADNSGDADITALYTIAAGAATVNAGYELLVWTSETYAPGAAVVVDDIDINGTLTLGSNAATVLGSWDATGGTFTTTGTVTFTSTTTETITNNGRSFTNITLNGSGGHWNLQDAMDVDGALIITAGTLDLNGSNLTNTGGTFSNTGTLRALGSETFTGFTNDTDSGTTYFDGTGTYSSLASLTTFNHLTLSGAGATWTLAAAIDANGLITLAAGTLDASASNYGITTAGGWTDTGAGTFTERSGTVTFDGTSTINANEAFNNVTVNGAGITVSLGAALDVNGTLTITAGTLDVTTNNYAVTVAANWSNSGTFTGRSGTVTFDGTNQTVAGSTTFYNLTKSGSSAATWTFTAGTTQTVSNTWTATGASGQLLSLRSSVNGTQWAINPQSTRTLSFIDVKDSNNTNASVILCSNDCTNSGNNSNWAFPILVTVYTDEGTTIMGANRTVAVSVNGGAKTAVDTNSSSVASFTTVGLAAGDVVTFWLDDENEDGATVSISNATTLTFSIYQNRLLLQHEQGSGVTTANLDTANNASDSDIDAVYTLSGTALTVPAGKELYINTADTFIPGGTVTTDDLDINGTFTMGSNTVTLLGSWDATGGTFTGSNTVTFQASQPETVTSNGNSFNNLTYEITGSGSVANTDVLNVTGTQTVRAGSSGGTDTTAPTISAVEAIPGGTQAAITWTTNESADSKVEYGTTSSLGSEKTDTTQTVRHAVTITGLTVNTEYSYKVTSKDSSNNTASSSVATFTTLSSGTGTTTDTTAPTISDIRASTVTDSSAQVTWTTNEATASNLDYGESTTYNRGATSGTTSTRATSHTVTMTGLTGSTTYHYRVVAIDAAGNIGTSIDQTLTTSATPAEEVAVEATPETAATLLQAVETKTSPEAPAITSESPAVTDITRVSATVSWTTSKVSSSLVYYRPVGSKELPLEAGTSTLASAHRVKLTGLAEGTVYEYAVESVDGQGNRVRSKSYQFTTTLPEAKEITIQAIEDISALFAYVTDQAAPSIIELTNLLTGETVTIEDSDLALEHKVALKDLDPNTEYSAVILLKGANGELAKSLAYIFKTREDTLDPIISALETRSALVEGQRDAVQTIVTWQTNEPASSQVQYNEGLTSDNEFKFATDENKDAVIKHVLVLPDLRPSTVYQYRVKSVDKADNVVVSEPRVLLTPQRRVSVFDLIIRNLEVTFGWTRQFTQ